MRSLSIVTIRSTVPLAMPPEGDLHTIRFGRTICPATESMPYEHMICPALESSPRPVTETSVPPLTGPLLGAMPIIVRAAPYSKLNVLAGRSTPLLLTPRLTVP